jgi:hypothetical protein
MRGNKTQTRDSSLFRRICLLVFISMLPLMFVEYLTAVSAAPPIHGTYLGGDLPDYGQRIAVDEEGGVYMVGRSESTNFPTGTNPLHNLHGIDAFVAKFNSEGSQAEYILWFYTLALFALDEAVDVVVDSQGYAYVVGNTASDDFCTLFGVVPGYDTTYNGGGDAFLLKVQADGSGLVYCTFLGGSDLDRGTAVALDDAGNVYVTGGTFSTDFITSTNTLNSQHNGERDAFVLVLDATGTAVRHASLFGGSGQDEGKDIILDTDNNLHVTGWTNSTNFATTPGVLGPSNSGDFDAFLLKLNTSTPILHYATYLGGSSEDRGYALAVDNDGHAYVGGLTRSSDFPTTPGSFDTTLSGSADGFVAKVNPDATALSYSTFLGGQGDDQINDVALAENQHLFTTGDTASTDFPTTTLALQPALPGPCSSPFEKCSAFVTVLAGDGRHLTYSTFLGGNEQDQGLGIALGANDWVYISGATQSTDFPVAANAFATSNSGDYDAYFSSFVVTVTNDMEWSVFLPVVVGR